MSTKNIEGEFKQRRCEGGTGDSGHRIIPDATSEAIPAHTVSYLGIDIVALYVNKESGWLNERIVIGAAEVTIGENKVQRLLGPFTVQKETKFAPTYEVSLLQDQPYRGDRVKIKIMLRADKKDTPMKPVLEALVGWGARIGGSYLPLILPGINIMTPARASDSANDTLLESMKQFIFSSKTQEPIFDIQSGIEFELKEVDLLQKEVFVLIHRGQPLHAFNIHVRKSVNGSTAAINPTLYVKNEDGSEFAFGDGAFILLRIKRDMVLNGARPWDAAEDGLYAELNNIKARVGHGDLTRNSALAMLQPDKQGTLNLYSAYMLLREMISKDPRLILNDRIDRAEKLSNRFKAIKAEISGLDLEDSIVPAINSQPPQALDTDMIFRAIIKSGTNPLQLDHAKLLQLPAPADQD